MQGTPYMFRVSAVNKVGQSLPEEVLSAVTPRSAFGSIITILYEQYIIMLDSILTVSRLYELIFLY